MEKEEDEIEPVQPRARKRRKTLDDVDNDEIRSANSPDDEDTGESPLTNGNEELSDEDADMDEGSVGDDLDEDNEVDLELMKSRGFSYAGILESVQLDRFMSHECFEYKLGPNVNVVNGANGSGKSAIVAALQIGLGAKANATERGSKMQDHIMHGKESAIITIRIHNRKPVDENEPDMTFRYDQKTESGRTELVYGNKIIIERRLVRKGTAQWAVKNWQGKQVDLQGRTARHEVRDIIDHFGFMVDNPVAILTQTKSKAFLAKGRASEHFQLYKAATLLGPLEEELNKTMLVANSLQVDLRQKKKNVPAVEKDLENLQRAHEEAQELKNIDQRIGDAQTLFAWTLLAEAQDNLTEMETRTENEFQPAADQAEEAYTTANAKVMQLNEQIATNHEQVQAANVAANQSFEAVRDSKRNEKAHRMEITRHDTLSKNYEEERQGAEQSVQQVTEALNAARLQHLAGQGRQEAMARQLQEATGRIEMLTNQLGVLEDQERQARDKKFEVEQAVPKAKDEYQRMNRDYERKRADHMYQVGAASEGSTLFRFGQAFPDLSNRIYNNLGRFHEEPVGPIGQFMKVKDQEWAPAIESYLGMGTLQSFIVHDSHDANVLRRLLPSHPKPTIIVADLRRDRYPIGDGDVPAVGRMGHCTILDMLEIEHNAVFNSLVDQNSIERVALVGNGDDITQLGWSRLRNLAEVWNKRGERAYSRNGSNTFRKAAMNMRTAGRILVTDRTQYLAALEHDVRQLEQMLQEQNGRVQEAVGRVRRVEEDMRRFGGEAAGARRSLEEAHGRKSQIEEQISQATTAFDARPFEEDVARFQAGVVDAEKRRDAELGWIAELQQKIADMEAKSAEATAMARGKKLELKELTRELEETTAVLATARAKMSEKKAVRARAVQRLQAAHEEIESKKGDVAEKMGMCAEFGERPDEVDTRKRPSAKINREVKKLQERLAAEQERRGGKTADEIEAEYLRAKKKHREMMKFVSKIEFYDSSLQNGIKKRLRQRKTLEKLLRKVVRNNFRTFLAARGHTGNIVFSRNERGVHELKISTKMASHQKGEGERYETKDLRSLSGGERSFTTLAFMLALAEVTQNPIRVMDEIDVFQDEANRRASFKTLVDYCSSILTDKQFVIITPLALPDIQPTDSVRIVRLMPPRRGEGGNRRIEDMGGGD